MLFTISAPSGTGKTTIVKEILKINSNLRLSVSVTTRPIRNNEKDGDDYIFVDSGTFFEMIKKNEFIEYENVFGNDYYGTLRSQIEDYLKNECDVIFDIDVKGAFSIKKEYKSLTKLIYIVPPDKESVIERLKKRGTESLEQINTRINRYEWEMSKINEFDYVIINDNLNSAVKKVDEIIKIYNINK
jgi:guanylate kinase